MRMFETLSLPSVLADCLDIRDKNDMLYCSILFNSRWEPHVQPRT